MEKSNTQYWQVLGLPYDSPIEKVKSVYMKMMTKCHPDKLNTLKRMHEGLVTPELETKCHEYSCLINEVYRVMISREEQYNYLVNGAAILADEQITAPVFPVPSKAVPDDREASDDDVPVAAKAMDVDDGPLPGSGASSSTAQETPY